MTQHPASAAVDPPPAALEPELAPVLEIIAREVHDEWMRRRLEEGWRHGPSRDDARREHPSLLQYEELSESERAYDRITALATIRALRDAGYRILPPAGAGGPPGAE